MSLITRFLPVYQFAETHTRYIPAAPAAVLDAVSRPEVVDDPVARLLIALRELPNRLAGRLGFASALRQQPAFGLANFTFLGRDGDHEVAFGLAGRVWQADYGLHSVADAEAFAALSAAGMAKLVMNFSAQAEGTGTRLTTSTRVYCGDAAALRRFRPYWWLIRPASGLIRRRLLQRVHAAATLSANC
ncbi:hypothetical protein [uncultured Aquitalea sp.]|uniref:hypothetical protein n=1 Tax=uncultured Aquitalea sp. TaxID=540272 RepID=UPI0025FAAD05|nr:hypothetical protein [uncultured Aquitalea sp.]